MMTTIYRPITEQDLDELYKHPEAEKWLVPTYRTREYAEAVECGCQMAVEGGMKLYKFPSLHPMYQPESYYIFTLGNDMLAFRRKKPEDNFNYYFSVVFLSKNLEKETNKYLYEIKKMLGGGGEYLFGNADKHWIHSVKNTDFYDTKGNQLNDTMTIQKESNI